ncbi:MAG: hypothetical protein WA804_21955 [Terriglobales bacterium]|jgi:hypothetical protein
MAYGRKRGFAKAGGHKSIMGVKLSGNRKGGPGFKLHSDMRPAAAAGHKQAPKAARKAV